MKLKQPLGPDPTAGLVPGPVYDVVYMDPKDLKAHGKNFKRHPPRQVVALDQSLNEAGWVLPVLWNQRTGRLVDGHARVRLAKERGEKVPVHVLDLDDAAEQRLLASLDHITALAELDEGALAKLLQDCVAAGDLPPGYTPEDYTALLDSLNPPDRLLAGDDDDPAYAADALEGIELSHIRMVQLFYSEADLQQFERLAAAAQTTAGTKNVSETMLWLLEHYQ